MAPILRVRVSEKLAYVLACEFRGLAYVTKKFAMTSKPRFLTALPVYNERTHVGPVLDEVTRYAGDILVVDDGSTDGTSELLAARSDVRVIRHETNRGSRYLSNKDKAGQAPAERRQINTEITRELNQRLGLQLTDGFCGFKAYRVAALAKMRITEPGYGMPLELWVQAAHLGLRIVEIPVPLIYLEEVRSFGGSLDDGRKRMEYYHRVLDSAINAAEQDVLEGITEADDALQLRTQSASETPSTAAGCECC